MLTIDVDTEKELRSIATLRGLSVIELLHRYVAESRSEIEAVKRADESYGDYLKTGKTVTHKQMKANDLDS